MWPFHVDQNSHRSPPSPSVQGIAAAYHCVVLYHVDKRAAQKSVFNRHACILVVAHTTICIEQG